MSDYARWVEFRASVLAAVQCDRRRRTPALRLTRIDHAALVASRQWTPRRVDWPWLKLVQRAKNNRLELAVWHADILCGLAVGPATSDWIGIGFLEGNPDSRHPLRGRVIDIAVAVLEAQAHAAAVNETRLLQPLPELVQRYRRFGYEPVAERPDLDYLRKTRMGP